MMKTIRVLCIKLVLFLLIFIVFYWINLHFQQTQVVTYQIDRFLMYLIYILQFLFYGLVLGYNGLPVRIHNAQRFIFPLGLLVIVHIGFALLFVLRTIYITDLLALFGILMVFAGYQLAQSLTVKN